MSWWNSLFGNRQQNALVTTTWEKQGVADEAYPREFAVKIAEISSDKRVVQNDNNYACSKPSDHQSY